MPAIKPHEASRSALQLDADPTRDMPDRELAGQLRLVEAVTLSRGREIGQAVRWQPCLPTLARLPLDRLDHAPGGRLRRGHAAVVSGFTVTVRL